MKKVIISLSVFFLASCSSVYLPPYAISPMILEPVGGLLYRVSSDLEYMFFPEKGIVLVVNNDNLINNSYYLLEDGQQVVGSKVITFRLGGQGVNVGDYIGILLHPGATPELGISVQKTRELAANAALRIPDKESGSGMVKGMEIVSSMLFFLGKLSPFIISTVAENSITKVTLETLTVGETIGVSFYQKQNYAPNQDLLDISLNLTTNISPDLSLLNYQQAGGGGSVEVKLWAAAMDYTNYKLAILSSPPLAAALPTLDEIIAFEETVETNIDFPLLMQPIR